MLDCDQNKIRWLPDALSLLLYRISRLNRSGFPSTFHKRAICCLPTSLASSLSVRLHIKKDPDRSSQHSSYPYRTSGMSLSDQQILISYCQATSICYI